MWWLLCISLCLQMPQDGLTSETLRSSLLYQQPQSLIQPSLQAEMDCDVNNPLQVGVLSWTVCNRLFCCGFSCLFLNCSVDLKKIEVVIVVLSLESFGTWAWCCSSFSNSTPSEDTPQGSEEHQNIEKINLWIDMFCSLCFFLWIPTSTGCFEIAPSPPAAYWRPPLVKKWGKRRSWKMKLRRTTTPSASLATPAGGTRWLKSLTSISMPLHVSLGAMTVVLS